MFMWLVIITLCVVWSDGAPSSTHPRKGSHLHCANVRNTLPHGAGYSTGDVDKYILQQQTERALDCLCKGKLVTNIRNISQCFESSGFYLNYVGSESRTTGEYNILNVSGVIMLSEKEDPKVKRDVKDAVTRLSDTMYMPKVLEDHYVKMTEDFINNKRGSILETGVIREPGWLVTASVEFYVYQAFIDRVNKRLTIQLKVCWPEPKRTYGHYDMTDIFAYWDKYGKNILF